MSKNEEITLLISSVFVEFSPSSSSSLLRSGYHRHHRLSSSKELPLTHAHTHKLITRWKMRCNLLIPRRFTNLGASISEKMTSRPNSPGVCVCQMNGSLANFCTGKRVIFMTSSCDVNDCRSRGTIPGSELDDNTDKSRSESTVKSRTVWQFVSIRSIGELGLTVDA